MHPQYTIFAVAIITQMAGALSKRNVVNTVGMRFSLSCSSLHPPVWYKFEDGKVKNLAFGSSKLAQFTDSR